MPHRPKPTPARRAAARAPLRADLERLHDKGVIVDLFATWHPSRCGRAACARARACVEPLVPCFEENRDNLRDAVLDLAQLDLFVDPEADGADDGHDFAYGDV